MKKFSIVFLVSNMAYAGHPADKAPSPSNEVADSINIERIDKGSLALAERISALALCTASSAHGGSKSSTLHWYFAVALSVWNNEVLEHIKTSKPLNFDKEKFSHYLETSLLKRINQKEMPSNLKSMSANISDALKAYTENVFVHSQKLGVQSTKSMSRLPEEVGKTIRSELDTAHAFSKTQKIDCSDTKKPSKFWAQYSFMPDDAELSTAEKAHEAEADKRLASSIIPTEAAATTEAVAKATAEVTPTKITQDNSKLESDIEESLDKRSDHKITADSKKSSDKKVRATVYYVPDENNYPASKNCSVKTKSGKTIAMVNCAFKEELAIQGTGILSDGRTVNFASKGRYMVTPHKYGLGSDSNPLVPFKSLAIDVNYWSNLGIKVKNGDKLYIKSTDGMKIPGTNEVHNGIWEVSDRGGKIKGNRIDLFFGTMSWRKALTYVNDKNNFVQNNHNTAQLQNIGSKTETLDVNFIL